MIKTQENSDFPSDMNRNCVPTQSLYSVSTHQTHLICHGDTAAETTFKITQYMCCVLTNCTRTTAPHIERVINCVPERLLPPWSEKSQQRPVSVTFLHPAISISVSQLESWWRAGWPTPFMFVVNPSAELWFLSAVFLEQEHAPEVQYHVSPLRSGLILEGLYHLIRWLMTYCSFFYD